MYTCILFGRAPTIAIHGVSNYAREGAPEPETVTVAKITRPGTPETASPAVEGPNQTRTETGDTKTHHSCARVAWDTASKADSYKAPYPRNDS